MFSCVFVVADFLLSLHRVTARQVLDFAFLHTPPTISLPGTDSSDGSTNGSKSSKSAGDTSEKDTSSSATSDS